MPGLRKLRRYVQNLPPRVALPALGVIAAALALGLWALVSAASDSSDPEAGARGQMVTAVPTRRPPATATATPLPELTATPSPAPAPPVQAAAAPARAPSATTYTVPAGPPRPAPGPAAATGHWLTIPRFGVSAPINLRVVGPDGAMLNPNGPTDVVWYDFSAFPGLGGFPGSGGNAVFAGHVDYRNYGPAVFWNARNLAPGDLIEVHLADGNVIHYSVQWSQWVDPAGDFTPYVAAGPEEYITLVTCIGTFDYSTRQYSNRLVVRGVRIP